MRLTQAECFATQAGVQLLMAMRDLDYTHISTFCNWLLLSAPRTPDGMLYLNDKQSAQYAGKSESRTTWIFHRICLIVVYKLNTIKPKGQKVTNWPFCAKCGSRPRCDFKIFAHPK